MFEVTPNEKHLSLVKHYVMWLSFDYQYYLYQYDKNNKSYSTFV